MPTAKNYGLIANQPFDIDGTTRPLRDWSHFYGVPFATVRMRWQRGERDPAILFFKPHYRKEADGTEVYVPYATKPGKRTEAQKIEANSKQLINILGDETTAEVTRVAADMEMTPSDVVKTLVDHGLKKLNKQ